MHLSACTNWSKCIWLHQQPTEKMDTQELMHKKLHTDYFQVPHIAVATRFIFEPNGLIIWLKYSLLSAFGRCHCPPGPGASIPQSWYSDHSIRSTTDVWIWADSGGSS